MTKQKPKVPPSKIPIIGDKVPGQEIVETIMSQLRPVIDKILTAIDGLERRLAVVEEVKQLFPAHVTVTVKHEYTEDAEEEVEERYQSKLFRQGEKNE